MTRNDDPLRPLKEAYSLDRWTRIENARDQEPAEVRDTDDWLVRLIERKLRGGE